MSKSIDKDDFLLKMLHSGDPQSMTVLFREYSPMITRIVYRIVGDVDIAKDIVQELFITLWEKRNELNIKKPVKSYLIRAAINQAFYYLRMQGKISSIRISQQENLDALLGDTGQSPEKDLTFKELEEHFQGIIEKLPPKCKLVYQLSRDEGMTYAEIANHLNVSVKAVEKHITKALKTLRGAFKTLLIFFMGI